MSYMRSTDSAVLQEFGRIMEEKEQLKKVAQVQPAPANQALVAYQKKLQELQNRAKTPNPQHDPKLMISRRELEQLSQLGKAVSPEVGEQASGPLLEYDAGRDPKAVLLGVKTHQEAAAVPHNRAALSAREKIAEQKSYDVTGKEDVVREAHPKSAKVDGEVVENLNEQQDADLAVAQKSAKNILVALYKLAKRLKAEKNMKAYSLVKETFLDLSKSLKK